MTPDELDALADEPPMDRWAIPLFEAPAALPLPTPVTEEDYPLRLESMPEEGFHPKLRFFRDAG